MMPQDQRYELDRMGVKSALDQTGVLGEPILAQLDEWSRNTIMNNLYEFDVYANPKTGVAEKYVKNCRYPDIQDACGYALSHLNLDMNLTWEESRAQMLDWRGLFYTPLRKKYHRDEAALSIITCIDQVINRNIMGGSASGSHQDFLTRLTGSHRKVEVTGGEQK